jgi:hypothetical protein
MAGLAGRREHLALGGVGFERRFGFSGVGRAGQQGQGGQQDQV